MEEAGLRMWPLNSGAGMGVPLGDVEEERTESVQGWTWSLVVTGA